MGEENAHTQHTRTYTHEERKTVINSPAASLGNPGSVHGGACACLACWKIPRHTPAICVQKEAPSQRFSIGSMPPSPVSILRERSDGSHSVRAWGGVRQGVPEEEVLPRIAFESVRVRARFGWIHSHAEASSVQICEKGPWRRECFPSL